MHAYRRSRRDGSSFKKMGREGDYPGGSVWQTFEEAEKMLAACARTFSVFGVLANWERDTAVGLSDTWHDLLVSSELVPLGRMTCPNLEEQDGY